ncbi:MAG: polysaccharide deacetylase family protein [Candidatus Limnocylindrales bacterium]
MRFRSRSVLLLVLATAAFAAAEAGASAQSRAQPVPNPLVVRTSYLRQDGQRLVWYVRTREAFSPNELNRDHRELCLLVERAATATAVGELCVKHPGSRQHPQLVYSHLTRSGVGRPRVIAATVTRRNAQELTASFLPSEVQVDYRPLRWQVLSATANSACASVGSSRSCDAKFPAFPALARLHTPRIVGCTASGPALAFNGARTSRVVALTFDDGPWPDTPAFLDILEREHVPATFFQIGEQIASYGSAVDNRMLADGDIIGDHTWSHANVAGAGPLAASQISQASAAIQRVTGGFRPCLFRPPGGSYSSALVTQARGMGFTTILWDVDPADWSRPGTDAIYQRVVGAVRNGSIVIQHDGGGDRSQTLAALPREIATLKARGFRFVTVAALLGQRVVYR